MSLLAPFYILGALAISLPILFHLIRRQPQGETPFSSLIFLRPTPPRLTRRSRLENWPLLLIRALILGLLAAAFARPLFRSVELADAQQTRTATVLLVDTSASMRRAGLWEQALEKANGVIEELQMGDQLALVQFDSDPTTLVSFDQSSQSDVEQLKLAAKTAIKETSPTWHRTDMGRAIRFATELATSRDDDGAGTTIKVVLISDMQEAANVESLQAYAWPEDVELDIRRVVPARATNASATILTDSGSTPDDAAQVRVRVTNAPHSTGSNFRIGWSKPDGNTDSLPVQVPPGQSRVVRLPEPDAGVRWLALMGDDDEFDNQWFYVVPESQELTLLHVGPDPPESRDSTIHYLRQTPLSDRYRKVTVQSIRAEAFTAQPSTDTTPLVVVDDGLSVEAVAGLTEYLAGGGRVLAVLADAERGEKIVDACNAISESQLVIGEAQVSDYAMLSKINFGNPLFAPMSAPPYNDFSKIRFWSHRSLGNLSEAWTVLANFDDREPALVETSIGTGKLWILTAGWQPSASQLALSTKFVPLLFQFVDFGNHDDRTDNLTVGQQIPFPPSDSAVIETPGGKSFDYRSSDDLLSFMDQPGVYRWIDGDRTIEFAVNLDPMESRTEPIGDDVLEQFGVKLDSGKQKDVSEAQQRQLRDTELEGRQRIWQWLLAAALGLLGLETWMGKRAGKQANEPSLT